MYKAIIHKADDVEKRTFKVFKTDSWCAETSTISSSIRGVGRYPLLVLRKIVNYQILEEKSKHVVIRFYIWFLT